MKKLSVILWSLLFAAGLYAQDIDVLLGSMSRKEKIAQIIIVAIDSQDTLHHAQQAELAEKGLGGLIVMDDNLSDNMQLVNELQAHSRIPMIVTIDGEWGASMRYREFAQFPRAMQLGALTDDDFIYAVGQKIGEELRELKIFANFAPVVDINNNPNNPVINTRSFGEDREKVAKFGVQYMKGMRDAGVAGSAKHFPGHGDTDVDSHKGLPVLTFDRARLDSLELYPFRKQIGAGVDMIMVGHLSVPALDSTGTPASISKPIVTDLLRNELGYDGIIITDALGMKGVAEGDVDASVAAYKAGADILLMPLDAEATIRDLDAAFEKGELSESDLNHRVKRMLGLKARCGMLSESYSPFVDTSRLSALANRPMSRFLIQNLSDRSMTVVKGSDKLPFRFHDNVAYVAFNATSDASKEMYKELRRYGNIPRFDLPADASKAQIDSVGRLVKKYKKIIVGFHSGKPVSSSGGPKRFARIDPQQLEWISKWADKHMLFGCYMGNPYDLNFLPAHKNFTTFIICYSDNEFNNKSAARAITVAGASGVLPVAAGGYPCGYSD